MRFSGASRWSVFFFFVRYNPGCHDLANKRVDNPIETSREGDANALKEERKRDGRGRVWGTFDGNRIHLFMKAINPGARSYIENDSN